MPQALTRIAPELLPVPYNRPAVPALVPERPDALRAEPPRTEVHYSSRYGRTGKSPNASLNTAAFATQQLVEEARSPALLLMRRGPLLAGYGTYATTAQQTDPNRPRPGQKLDVSA